MIEGWLFYQPSGGLSCTFKGAARSFLERCYQLVRRFGLQWFSVVLGPNLAANPRT